MVGGSGGGGGGGGGLEVEGVGGGEEGGAEAGAVVGVDDDDGGGNVVREELLEGGLQAGAEEGVVLEEPSVHGDDRPRDLSAIPRGAVPPHLLQDADDSRRRQPGSPLRHHVADPDHQLPRLQRGVRDLKPETAHGLEIDR